MDFGLSDEQEQLRASARSFLARECPARRMREIVADAAGLAPELDRQIAQLGWTGLIVPEQFGGAGLGMLDMAVLLEECGYAALPGPFLFSAAIAAFALAAGGGEEINSRWLGPLAAGDAIGTVAIAEANDSLNPAELTTVARPAPSGAVLNGVKMFVPYAQAAQFIVVAARTGPGPREVALFVVDARAPGVKVRPLKSLDLTRRLAIVELDGVLVEPAARLSGDAALFDRVLDAGAIAIAADAIGGTQRALDMAVEYAQVREQFGKPIGSFQAIKHAAAEIVADLEPTRALLWYAAYAFDALPREAARAAAMAKARAADVYSRAAGKAVLMHGGIGFTWEHDIHFWFKRARLDESLFGAPPFHRERVAALGGY